MIKRSDRITVDEILLERKLGILCKYPSLTYEVPSAIDVEGSA